MHRRQPLGGGGAAASAQSHKYTHMQQLPPDSLRRLLTTPSVSQDSVDSIRAYTGRTDFGVPFFTNICFRKLGLIITPAWKPNSYLIERGLFRPQNAAKKQKKKEEQSNAHMKSSGKPPKVIRVPSVNRHYKFYTFQKLPRKTKIW